MAVHSPPLQGSQDVGSIDGGIVPKDLEGPDYLIHGSKVTPDLASALRDVAVTVCEHFLLLSFLLLHVPFECLTSALLFLSLAFLTVGGFMSSGDENFLLSGWLWLQPPLPQCLCILLLCLVSSSCSLVGVLARLFGSEGAGDDVRFDCTLMLRLASICLPDSCYAKPKGMGDCLTGDTIVLCRGGTLFTLVRLRSSSALGPCGSSCIL